MYLFRSLALGLTFATCVSFAHAAPEGFRAAPDKPATMPTTATTTGQISGIVADPTGAAIPQAIVTATLPGHAPVQTTSDAQGHYSFNGLPPGTYVLDATEAGFQALHMENINVAAGSNMNLTLTLTIASNEESVTVSADTPTASTEDNGDAISLSKDNIDALSDDPDELSTQLQAISGADADTGSQIYVDGFSGGRLPPKNAIREIRINHNPYSAQFDQVGYGRIEILTKPGADTLHGSFWMQGNDSALNAPNPLLPSQPPYHHWQLSTDVNGPASKNASYFLSLWTRHSATNAIIKATILDSSFNPVDFSDAVSTPSSHLVLTPRFDWQWGNHTLTARYVFDHGSNTNSGVGQFSLADMANNSSSTAHQVQLSDSQAISATLMNEVHFQYTHGSSSSTPVSTAATISVQGAFTGGGSGNNGSRDSSDNYELWDLLRLTRGPHDIIFGGRARAAHESNYSTGNYNGSWTFDSLTAYQITEKALQACQESPDSPDCLTPTEIRAAGGGASLFSQTHGTPSIDITTADWDLYAEDNWKMRPNVTLGYGLRFESQTGIHDHADFAPRVAVAWSIPSSNGGDAANGEPALPHLILRGGYGIFYNRFSSGGIMQARRQNGVTQTAVVVRNPDFYPDTCTTDPEACAEGADSTSSPTIYTLSPTLHAPYTMISGVGADKPIGKHAKISIDYSYMRGVHQFETRNINAPLPGTYDPDDPTSGERPLDTNENIYEYGSEGASVRNRLNISGSYNSRQAGLWGYVAVSKAESNTGGFGSFASNSYDQDADWGRAGWDARSHGAIGGYTHLPGGFGLNPFLLFRTSSPFNIVTSQDLNGDTIYNDRPAFATDMSRSSVYHTQWGDFDADPMPGQKIIPINYGKGPGQFVFNLVLNKRFRFGPVLEDEDDTTSAAKPEKSEVERKYMLSFSMRAENLTNHPNYTSPVGVLGSSLFGTSTALTSPASSIDDRSINFETFFHF